MMDYIEALERIESLEGDVVNAPIRIAKRAQDFHDDGNCLGIGLFSEAELGQKLPEGSAEVNKGYLIDYLIEASASPCHCGSGKRYERCHSSEELSEMVNQILEMNKGE